MKKIFLFIIAAALVLIPAIVKAGEAECLFCKEKFGIESVERFDDVQKKEFGLSAIKKDMAFSTTIHLKMLDGNEFFIPVKVTKNLSATLEFASGKTAFVSPWGVSVVNGSGYQQFDDVQNSVDFMVTYGGDDWILYVILCLGLSIAILGLYFCYLAIITC